MQGLLQGKILTVFAMPLSLLFLLLSVNPCEAKGLPKDLGIRMAKIYEGESGQAGLRRNKMQKFKGKKPKIKVDSETLKLSTERIELSELMRLIEITPSCVKPDKTANTNLDRLKFVLKIEDIKAAEL